MAFTYLFGRSIFMFGATHIALIALMRWTEKNIDFQKLIKDVDEGLDAFVKEVRNSSDEVKGELKTFFEELNKLKGLESNKLLNLEDVTTVVTELLRAYRALPELMRKSINQCIDVEESLKSIMKKAYSVQGWALIGVKPTDEQSLNSYLAQQYKGLHYLGCAEERVNLEDLSELMCNLSHFHSQLGRHEDMLMVAWIENTGVDKAPLERVLSLIPEVIQNELNNECIAYALGENVDIDFDTVFKMRA